MAELAELRLESLPYDPAVLDFLHQEHASGRPLVLATAANENLAQAVADQLGIFSEVIGSDSHTNQKGATKARTLVRRYGVGGFDYLGDSQADYAVFRQAQRSLWAGSNPPDSQQSFERVFTRSKMRVGNLLHALRPHQWAKNLLLFVPLLMSHQLNNGPLLLNSVTAFCCFCLCASGVYLFNDLLDMDADRQHPTKQYRAIAAGALPIPTAIGSGLALWGLGGLLAGWISTSFQFTLLAYLLLTTTYSVWLKQLVLVDVFVLAGLYTLRIVAGHVATGISYSPWLMMFSIFVFLSLGLVKRFAELQRMQDTVVPRRGYQTDDRAMLQMFGAACACVAALIIALYLRSPEVHLLYVYPAVLWLVSPAIAFWLFRMWLLASRGEMHDDPVVFACRDPTSYGVGTVCALLLVLASGILA